MLTNNFRTPLALRALVALAAACLAAGAPGAASAMPVGSSAIGSITIALTRHPQPVSGTPRAEFGWRTTGIVGETRCKLDGAAYTYCRGNPGIYGGLADGRHTFTVRVRNGYRVTAKATFTWLVDTAAPTVPDVSGGSAAWRNAASAAVAATGSTDALSGMAGYQWRVSTDGSAWSAPAAGATATVRAQGVSYVQFRSVDRAGNTSAWSPAGHPVESMVRLDRTPPTAPTVIGGSPSWQDTESVIIDGAASTDARSGVDHYEYRESVDGGPWSSPQQGTADTVTREGQTVVQFRAVDAAGNAGAWTPATPGAENTVRLDRSGPSDPIVTGGSSGWRSAASVTVSASGSVDTGFGVDRYEYRTSVDGGTTWSSPLTGTSVTVSAEGQTFVQFRALDTAGNPSDWAPDAGDAAGIVRLDRTAPADPTVGITPAGWQSAPSIEVFAGGATDALSGVDHYQFRSSADGGTTWTAPVDGATGWVSQEGATIVQFRAVDAAGNLSAWAPATAGPANTVNIDHTAPAPPSVVGGSAGWQTGASIAVSAIGGSDALSGLDHEEYRTSTDGGDTWSAPSPGALVNVTAEGETLVQFRTVDAAGNPSTWVPSSGTAGTVRLDRTAPGDPAVAGGSLAWQSAASVTVSATGGPDTGSGVAGYSYRTSTDGGVSWSTPAAGGAAVISAEGETLVQFQAVDAAGNTSGWAPAAPTAGSTVRIDRTAPTAPVVGGGSLAWQSVGSAQVSADGGTDSLSGVDHYDYRVSTDGGASWGAPAPGSADVVTAEGETVLQFRTVDAAGNTSGWAPAVPNAGSTVRIDRTPPPAPSATGGSLAWQNTAQVTVSAAGAADPLSGVAAYEYRTSTDGGGTWSLAAAGSFVSATNEGETLVQFRATDTAGNVSAWGPSAGSAGGTARIDRTAPSAPTVSGGSLSWQSTASVTVTASGATDSPGSGIASYQYRTSTDGGVTWGPPLTGNPAVITAQGETLVQFRAVDGAGFSSSWAPTVPDSGDTVRIDRTLPTAPVVTGGSLSWQNVASVTVSAAGSADTGGSGLTGYEQRTSTDGGATWTAPAVGSSYTTSAEGETLVEIRSVDGAGNTSAWTPSSLSAAATIRIDRTAPTAPMVSGGSLSWQSAPSLAVTASGATDSPGSGVASYQYRTSTDGGITWGAPATGNPALITAQGETVVQFRAVDAAGFASSWAPAVPGAGSTVRIDRTAPAAPAVSGGSTTWQNVASVTVSASGSTDTGGSGFAGIEQRTSLDNGLTWSAPSPGSSLTVGAEGQTLVQFRTTDNAGNTSVWTPASSGAANTIRIDRTVPTDPTSFAGGSLTWHTAASVAVTASGATDSPGSGIASYQYRSSTDGGTTWGAVQSGATATISAQGETIVQFRATDSAGYTSNWAPGAPTPATTVRLDRTAPTAPTLNGGSLSWQNVASVDVSASGSTDTNSGFAGYQYRTSVNGGASWTAAASGAVATVSAEGTTVVQFRSVDVAGNVSAWTPATPTAVSTVKIDRTPPTDPTSVTGGSLTWKTTASTVVTASGATDIPGSGIGSYQYRTSTDGGTTWSAPATGGSAAITAQGETLLQFRAVDASGTPSNWVPVAPTAGSTVRQDRTVPTAPAVTGGSSSWQSAPSVTITGGGSTDSGGSGLDHYELRTSTTNGSSWSAGAVGTGTTVTAEGTTLVQVRSVDLAGNASAWTPGTAGAANTAKLDRTPPAAPTTLAGGSLTWSSAASITVTASGATDTSGSGVSGYEYETSTDGGTTWGSPAAGTSVATTAQGETVLRFRSVDNAGNRSVWYPATGTVAGGTVRLDRTVPTAPSVSGGSLTWLNQPSETVTATGSTDAGGSGLGTYQYRTSTNGGATWGSAASGSSLTVTAEGETLVQFRSTDGAGNTSAWSPASPGATNTVRLDWLPPLAPSVAGGSSSWQSAGSVNVTASGGSDAGTGVASYEYRTSMDNGVTWSAASPGATAVISAEGVTLVQFRAVDGMGFVSSWAPATATAASTVKLDHTAPSSPAVAGGSASWQSVASVAVTASGSTDSGGSGLGPYQYRTSADGGATWSAIGTGSSTTVSAEGTTIVQFRSTDTSGNTSAWSPASAGAANAVKLDRTGPTAPSVTGGSLAWQSLPSVTVTPSGSTDAGAGVTGYQVRTSTNGGVNWSAASAASSLTVSAEGETLVEFRAVDALGNAGGWGPASNGAGNTVRIDRTAPTAPGAAGGSLSWLSQPSMTVNGSGATDVGGSGVAAYSYRTSTDGGATWSPPVSGSSVTVTAEGETLVQFQAIDQAGNSSPWAPAALNPGGTVRLDRTVPSAPAVTGGSLSWQSAGSVAVSAAGSTDSGGSGLAGYEYRLSVDNGVNWTAPVAANPAAATGEGVTIVQYRSVDGAGNVSAWSPTVPDAGSTVMLDRTGPSVPSVSGGSLAWQSVPSVTVAASGSSDAAVGLAGYEARTSTDGGVSWTLPSAGSSVTVTAEGQTLVQFRSVDSLGNVSAWGPSAATPGATVRIDRTGPTSPTLSGGSLAWQNGASVAVTGAGGTDALAGVASYEYRTSTDGGATWSASQLGGSVAVTAEGETLVQMRTIDGAGNTSAWAPGIPVAGSTVRLDRAAPTAPTVSGGSLAWQSVPSVTVSAAGSTDSGSGIAGYEHRTSTDGGTTWLAPVGGAAVTVTADGETLVQFRSVDSSGNRSAWAPATPNAGSTVRLDDTPPTAPAVSGGSLAWQSVPSVTVSAAGSVDALTGLSGYEYRESTDAGATWSASTPGSSVTVSTEGQTLVQFRSVDALGNASAWLPASPGAGSTVRIDRTAPGLPTVTGGSLAWQNTASVQIAASGSSDGLAGVTGYQYRTSTDGGSSWSQPVAGALDAIAAEGETLVQFRSVDAAGNTSAWAPASPASAGTARIDRTAPTAPAVAGGSLGWSNAASVTVTASGSTDNPGSGVASYAFRTSTDGGSTWSSPSAGSSVTVTAAGQTLVQFRATDVSGLSSAWAPASATAGSTVRIDRTSPVVPVVSGGSLAWQNTASVTISAAGASDALSGLARYEYRTSTDGGTTWSAPAAGSASVVTAEGQTLTQFRSVDNAGNTSAWNPGTGGSTNTVRIDRTAPTAPSVSGGSGWTNAASVTVTGSGATDSPGSGVASYQYRTSPDNGATWSAAVTGTTVSITAAGTTLVQFRSVDTSGLRSPWAPAAPTMGSTVSIDRTAPTAPAVTGGSLAWQDVAQVTVTASGGSDAGGSALATPQVRTSTNGGGSWSAPASAGSIDVTAEGQTLVEFRNVDGAGNASAWTPSPTVAGATVRIDRTAPTAPAVTGGSLTCTSGTRTLTASGATDAGGSGVAHYEYRISTDGGSTYGAAQPGASAQLSAPGTYVVQFRAVDGVGLAGAWGPGAPGAANTACIT